MSREFIFIWIYFPFATSFLLASLCPDCCFINIRSNSYYVFNFCCCFFYFVAARAWLLVLAVGAGALLYLAKMALDVVIYMRNTLSLWLCFFFSEFMNLIYNGNVAVCFIYLFMGELKGRMVESFNKGFNSLLLWGRHLLLGKSSLWRDLIFGLNEHSHSFVLCCILNTLWQ